MYIISILLCIYTAEVGSSSGSGSQGGRSGVLMFFLVATPG
jgi:hypothetical protein